MNFLAHLLLGPPQPQQALGSLLGDFVKGPVANLTLPPAVREGVWLHRRIDVFTDSHPLVLASKARVSNERRRFAGIMVDMFYDHLLARHWARFSAQPIEHFTQQMYAGLLAQQALIPEHAWPVIQRMAEQDWLSSYAELEQLERALTNMGRRLRRDNRLAGSVLELERDYGGFEADFLAFMPEVIDYAATQAAALKSDPDLRALLSGSPNA